MDISKKANALDEVAMRQRFYFPQLDGLRSLAFLMVFLSHAGGFALDAAPAWIHRCVYAYDRFLDFGWAGVDLFFTLSAFLITSILLREESKTGGIRLGRFLFRRVLRIWPVYYVAVVLGLLLFPLICTPGFVVFGTSGYWQYSRATFLWLATFTVNLGISWQLMNTPMTVAPLWSVSMEEQFYLFWGLLFKTVRSVRWRCLIIALLFGTTLWTRHFLQQHHPETHVPFYENTFARLDPILFGAVIALAIHYLPRWFAVAKRYGSLILFVTLGMIVVASVILPAPFFIAYQFKTLDLTVVDLCCALILLSLLTCASLGRMFSWSPLVKFGQLTYGMYVFHPFVIQTINTFILVPRNYGAGSNLTPLINIGLGLPITFLIAWVVWHMFEKRFYALKSKYATVQSGFM